MRREDWAERLAEIVEARRETPFAWGVHDCALFSADCVQAMTGIDYAQDFRGTYRSAKGALDALGHRDLAQILDEEFERIAPAYMGRGDVCLVDTGAELTGPACAVCVGALVVVAGIDGLQFFGASQALSAWRVE